MSEPTGTGGVLVRDSRWVEDVLIADDEWLDEQAGAVLQYMPVAARKIGAIGSAGH